jgi:hypothetical protein
VQTSQPKREAAHTVDNLGDEGRILIRDVGIEEFVWFNTILGIDVAGAFSITSSLEALTV